jgi:hypothetical protein
MSQHDVMIAEWSGQPGLSGTEDRYYRQAEERGQVHRAGIVCQEQATLAQFVD